MRAACPALLIAAPSSGSGKTTVAAALARLHARAGKRVAAFKCGPDFLDPYWLQLATGRPVYNLDLWMTGEDDIRARLYAAACESDLIIVEGVMGLFDGSPSAADIARQFGLPVLAVIDASSMAGTFGALAFGLRHYQPDLPWAGVLANRVASAGHAQMLAESIKEQNGPFMGAVLRDAAFNLPERHLGLTVATELPDALARLDAAADALQNTALADIFKQNSPLVSVEFAKATTKTVADVFGISENSEFVDEAQGAPQQATRHNKQLDEELARMQRSDSPQKRICRSALKGKTIAIARDTAFCFIYQANLDALKQLGAELVFFSPLADEALPPCDALWLPGGYPELHAEKLSCSQHTQASLQAHVAAGKPVWAECGGMMLLFEQLQTTDGQTHTVFGLLPGRVIMQQKLAGLGGQAYALPQGELRGHTFHYSRVETPLPPTSHTRTQRGGAQGEAVYAQGSIRASYFHAWFASDLPATAALFTGDLP